MKIPYPPNPSHPRSRAKASRIELNQLKQLLDDLVFLARISDLRNIRLCGKNTLPPSHRPSLITAIESAQIKPDHVRKELLKNPHLKSSLPNVIIEWIRELNSIALVNQYSDPVSSQLIRESLKPFLKTRTPGNLNC